MSRTATLPNHLRPRREKVFGTGNPCPLDREGKVRIWYRAQALSRRTEAGKHYGPLTAKALAVLRALLWDFHNSKSGLCFPSYEAIAEKAGCARSTVAEAIKALEEAGILAWVNRITRQWEQVKDLFGRWGKAWRVIRISNAYHFKDFGAGAVAQAPALPRLSSKSEIRSGTKIQELKPFLKLPGIEIVDPYDARQRLREVSERRLKELQMMPRR